MIDSRGATLSIGILETGTPPSPLGEHFGSYPAMIEDLLRQAASEHHATPLEFVSYPVTKNGFPKHAEQHHAYIITGSRHGVYEHHGWIEELKRFAIDAYRSGVGLIGICFGHQLLAEAFGGRVERSDKGWGLGQHDYAFCAERALLNATGAPDELTTHFRIECIHQDQVITLPEKAVRIATSQFCPNAGFVLPASNSKNENAFGVLTFQGHPEFSREYNQALLQLRRDNGIAAEVVDAALQIPQKPLQRHLIGAWMLQFILHNTQHRQLR